MHRTHWHAARADNSVSRDDKRSVTALGGPEGFGTLATAESVTQADKGSQVPYSFCEWYVWPCGCETGSRHWARVDSAVWCNLNS